MCWLIIVRNVETGGLEIVTPNSDFDPDDPRYGKDVHIIPFKEDPDPRRLNFGVHNLGSDCVCHPKMIDHCSGRMIITHQSAVN